MRIETALHTAVALTLPAGPSPNTLLPYRIYTDAREAAQPSGDDCPAGQSMPPLGPPETRREADVAFDHPRRRVAQDLLDPAQETPPSQHLKISVSRLLYWLTDYSLHLDVDPLEEPSASTSPLARLKNASLSHHRKLRHVPSLVNYYL